MRPTGVARLPESPALPADFHSTLLLVERPAQPTERASLAVSVSAVRPRAPPPS